MGGTVIGKSLWIQQKSYVVDIEVVMWFTVNIKNIDYGRFIHLLEYLWFHKATNVRVFSLHLCVRMREKEEYTRWMLRSIASTQDKRHINNIIILCVRLCPLISTQHSLCDLSPLTVNRQQWPSGCCCCYYWELSQELLSRGPELH